MEPIVRPYRANSGGVPVWDPSYTQTSGLPGFIPQLPGESPEAYAMRMAAQQRMQAMPSTMSPGPTPSLGQDIAQGTPAPGSPTGPTPGGPMPTSMTPPVQAPGAPMGPTPSLGQSLEENPIAPAIVGPPSTPEEKQGRLQSWINHFDNIKNDPQAMMMLLKFGTEMIQPIQPGQSALGHTGRAIQGSADYLGQLQSAEALRTKTGEESARLRAGTEQTQAETGAIPGKMEQTAAETARTKALTPTDEERQLGLDKDRQGLMKMDAEIRKLEEEIAQSPKNAESKRKLEAAHAKYYEALARWTETTRGKGGGTGGRPAAAVQNRADIERRVRSVTPKNAGESDQAYELRIQKKTLDYSTVHETKRQDERSQAIDNAVIFQGISREEAAVEFDRDHPPLLTNPKAPGGGAKDDPLGLRKK